MYTAKAIRQQIKDTFGYTTHQVSVRRGRGGYLYHINLKIQDVSVPVHLIEEFARTMHRSDSDDLVTVEDAVKTERAEPFMEKAEMAMMLLRANATVDLESGFQATYDGEWIKVENGPFVGPYDVNHLAYEIAKRSEYVLS